MSPTVQVTLKELPPELFGLIAAQVPLHNRVPTLFSLALASHHLHNIIIPHILYTQVRLVGEDLAVPVLKRFIREAEENVNNINDDHSTAMPTSHYIHDLCIHLVPSSENDAPLLELQKLIDCDGLPNLISLTIHRHEDLPSIPTTFWTSIQRHCPTFGEVQLTGVVQDYEAEWTLESEFLTILPLKRMETLRLQGLAQRYEYTSSPGGPFLFDLSKLPAHLHTLELRLRGFEGARVEGLFSSVMPDLNVLILDHVNVGDPSLTKDFWKKHPHLTRLELGRYVTGAWFNDFESGMLPNLIVLKSKFIFARILLPHISESLVRLCLVESMNAQALYLLRTIPIGGTLPALRSLGINRTSKNTPKPFEGHRWREDENGAVTEVPYQKAAKKFDENYLITIAKAAPNLEELELMGDSDGTIDSITSALCRFPKLSQLTLSGAINGGNQRFFESSYNWKEYLDWDLEIIPTHRLERYAYAPLSFDQAAYDLACGCPTLEKITIGNMIGDLLITDGMSCRIVRREDGEGRKIVELQRTRAWGNGIGKEDDW